MVLGVADPVAYTRWATKGNFLSDPPDLDLMNLADTVPLNGRWGHDAVLKAKTA